MRARATAWGLALALLSLAIAPAAHAQRSDVDRYLTAAARLYEDLEYERALDQLHRARQLSRGVDDDVTIALYEGVILADLGKRDEALAAFREGLYLKPDAKLPVKVSPKVEREFEALRLDVKKELAQVLAKQKAERPQQPQQPPRHEGQEARTDRPERQPAPEQPAKTLIVTAQPAPLPPAVAASTPRVEAAPQPGLPVLPFVLGGVAVAAGGTGAYFGLQARTEVDAAHAARFQDDAQAHLDNARGPAFTANVLFAAAGTAAAGALVSWLLSGDDAPAPSSAPASSAGSGGGSP